MSFFNKMSDSKQILYEKSDSKYISGFDPINPERRSFGMHITPFDMDIEIKEPKRIQVPHICSGLRDYDWQMQQRLSEEGLTGFKPKRKLAKNRLKKANKYTHYVS